MADLRDENIKIGKIEFSRSNVIRKTTFSIVFKGKYEGIIDVAIKRFPYSNAEMAEIERKRLLAEIDHVNVVKYYGMEKDDDFCYIAMELPECNLEEYFEKKENISRLPYTPFKEILRGVAEGLAHIHNKYIIHRDIKPSNILLFKKENKLIAKISDFGVSRNIKAGQAMSAILNAGMDLYKSPEILTPLFSWRNDVYAFGLLAFHVLSKGKHLFGNNVSHVIRGNPVNIKELNEEPDAFSLIKWLTAFDQEARPRMSEVVHHPYFWDDEKKINFITDVHKVTKDKQNLFLKEVIEEDWHEIICRLPDNCGDKLTDPNPGVCADWTSSLTPQVTTDLGKRDKLVTFSSVDLVRIIRNKFEHFNDLNEHVQAEYGGTIEEFRRYWLKKFPSLVLHLWRKVKTTKLTADLSNYYTRELDQRTSDQNSLLWAIRLGDLGEPQELFSKVKQMGSEIKDEVLRSAVEMGSKEHVEVLLKDSICSDANCKKTDVSRLLHLASANGHVEVAELLIKGGAEVKFKDEDGTTPLHEAVRNGHVDVTQLLIYHGAEINCENNYGITPLHEAARNGHVKVTQLLIIRKAKVDCKDNYGKTPLHQSALNGHAEVTQLLIEHRSKVNCKDKDGDTPLHQAVRNGHLEVTQLLIENGAVVDCRNIKGRTPFHEACLQNHVEVARLLTECGADAQCRDYNGRKAIDLLEKEGIVERIPFRL